MGGPGSTRWRGHPRKPRVEDALCLDLLEPGFRAHLECERVEGSIEWRDPDTETLVGWTAFRLAPPGSDGTRNLVLDRTGDPCEPKQVVILEPVQVGFSTRIYAQCPDGCGRRARKLFERPDDGQFLCQSCAGLQYTSAQQHDKRIDACRRDPKGFMAERSALSGARSALVTFTLYNEAVRRGLCPVGTTDLLESWAHRDHDDPQTRADELTMIGRVARIRLPKRFDRRRSA